MAEAEATTTTAARVLPLSDAEIAAHRPSPYPYEGEYCVFGCGRWPCSTFRAIHERDAATERAVLAEQTVERLRAKNHELATRSDRENARLQSDLASYRNDVAEALRLLDPNDTHLGYSWNETVIVAQLIHQRDTERHARVQAETQADWFRRELNAERQARERAEWERDKARGQAMLDWEHLVDMYEAERQARERAEAAVQQARIDRTAEEGHARGRLAIERRRAERAEAALATERAAPHEPPQKGEE